MVDRLVRAVAQLGDDELAVLVSVAEGAASGRRTYGELDLAADERDLGGEAFDELRDAVFYLAAAALRCRGCREP